jgi:hypothetical protein
MRFVKTFREYSAYRVNAFREYSACRVNVLNIPPARVNMLGCKKKIKVHIKVPHKYPLAGHGQ